MVGYNWQCAACEETNTSGTTTCKKCGCPAGASGDDVERFRNPEKYISRKVERKLSTSIMHLVILPILLLVTLYQGQLNYGAVMMVLLVVSIVTDKALIILVKNNSWALKMIASWCLVNTAWFVARLALPETVTDSVIIIMVFLWLLYFWAMAYLLFKSKRGKELVKEYQELKANQTL